MLPPINRDLVIAGAILHDIGRTLEFNDEIRQRAADDGRAGCSAICSWAAIWCATRPASLGDVNPELVQLLEHIHGHAPEPAGVGLAEIAVDSGVA